MSKGRFLALLAHLFGVLFMVLIGKWLTEAAGGSELLTTMMGIFIVGYFVVSTWKVWKGQDPLARAFEEWFNNKD